MKVDLAPFGCRQKAIIPVRHQLGDARMRQAGPRLHIASLTANVIFQLTRRSVECIADGNRNVLILLVFSRLARRHDLAARQGDIDVKFVLIAVQVVLSSRLDHDAAAHDVARRMSSLAAFSRMVASTRRMLHLPETDL
jgi:hypothetical protein